MQLKNHRVLPVANLLLITLCVLAIVSCATKNVVSVGKQVDFVEKYNVSENEADISVLLQKAIDDLPKGGVLYLREGIYRISAPIILKSNMTLKLDEKSVLLNCIMTKSSIMAFNHKLKAEKAVGAKNIVIEGGVWDMNGALGTDGNPKNLPNAETVGAFGFGYGSDITLRNITFVDGYNSHFIQVCAMENVLIENCRFEGQAFMGEGNRTREIIQIEPGSIKGYPYTLAQEVKPTKNVTIRNCYFGASEKSPEYMVAIGTHGQQNSVKCSDINIENCVFDNAAWCAIRFWAYDRVSIKDNKFIMTDVSNQKNRYAILADSHPYGAVIDTGGAHNTTNLVIANNIFEINAKDVTAIGVTGNGGSPKKPKDITITENIFTGSDSNLCIELHRVENCRISNNKINGFRKNIVATLSAQEVTADEYVEFVK